MLPDFVDRLAGALREQDPFPALKDVAMAMSKAGLGKQAIYAVFLEKYVVLQDQKQTREADILGDVMDMITDSFSRGNPHNMNLPG